MTTADSPVEYYGPAFRVPTRNLSDNPMLQVRRIVIISDWDDDQAHDSDHPDHDEYERQTAAGLDAVI